MTTDLLTVEQAAEILDMDVMSVEYLITCGDLPAGLNLSADRIPADAVRELRARLDAQSSLLRDLTWNPPPPWDDPADKLSEARGVVVGLAIGLGFWAVVIGLAVWVKR